MGKGAARHVASISVPARSVTRMFVTSPPLARAGVECDLGMDELRLFLNTCMQWHRERNPCISHVTKLDSVTMSADT